MIFQIQGLNESLLNQKSISSSSPINFPKIITLACSKFPANKLHDFQPKKAILASQEGMKTFNSIKAYVLRAGT